jgi:glycosyltransferase involved in cell wall biosynthesis
VRVLLVTDWTANEGGIETYVTRTSAALRELGHDVRLLTSSIAAGARKRADYVATATDNLVAQTFLQIVNPFTVGQVRAALREFRPDVVQVNMFEKYLSPAVFQALRGTPTVAFVHYYKPVCPTAIKVLPNGSLCEFPAGLVCWRSGCVGLAEWLRDRPRYALIRAGLDRAAAVLVSSEWMVALLGQNGIEAEAIPLPVPGPSPGFQRMPSPRPLFVYCGRLDRMKGVDLLLRSFARVRASRPGVELRVLGGGPRLTEVRARAAELGIADAVRFEGWVSFREVEAALAGAWALVAPSILPEPLGLVAIEAITRGVPAIASARGGFAETVEDGVSGYLVPNGNEDALTERLLAAADAGPASVPEDAARRLRQRHDVVAHATALVEIFHRAVSAAQRAH